MLQCDPQFVKFKSFPRNNDTWCISVPSHPYVTTHPVGRWCYIFSFRDYFLPSFMLRCSLPCYLPGQIFFYSLQREYTKCFPQVCMWTYVHRLGSKGKCFPHNSTMQWHGLFSMHRKMPLQFCSLQSLPPSCPILDYNVVLPFYPSTYSLDDKWVPQDLQFHTEMGL
jgi:hypothetical protein